MAKALDWIAIVDDDPAVLKALARLLDTRALKARTYRSARLFLASLSEGLPNCLIIDLQMPEMTGLELQQNLARKGIRIPTIIITAHDEAGMRERCKAAGAIAFLSKPLQDISLFAAIDAVSRKTRVQTH
jgi:FixJ family two-component response regulator